MLLLRIVENQNLNFETYIKLKNKSSQIIFACENSLLLSFYEHNPINPVSKETLVSLGYLFSHEIVKYFASKIVGGLFEVIEVSTSTALDSHLNYTDVGFETDNSSQNIHCARLYGTPLVIDAVNKFILNESIGTKINKVTGYPILWKELNIDTVYHAYLREEIRILQQRIQFLKCTYLIENTAVDFYFPEKIVRHFCSLVLRNSALKPLLPFHVMLGKIFAELFIDYLSSIFHVFVKTQSVEIQYVKNKELLEFNLVSNVNEFEFYTESKNKLFLIKLLTSLDFKEAKKSMEAPRLNQVPLPFSVEIGVTYLNQSEYKNLTQGDIIVFDKTCLSADTTHVDKCVINLNGQCMIASIHQNDTCQVTHFTKDW